MRSRKTCHIHAVGGHGKSRHLLHALVCGRTVDVDLATHCRRGSCITHRKVEGARATDDAEGARDESGYARDEVRERETRSELTREVLEGVCV